MDRELAGAVFDRWEHGLPVFESTLYKAASVLGADPDAVLTEARFYHHLDRALERGTGFTAPERAYFSAAAGYDHGDMEKTASAFGFESSDSLILRALRNHHFQPDIEKIAMLGMQGGPADGGGAAVDGPMMPQGGDEMGQPDAGPMPGAQLQQNPMVRPSPTAPAQVPSADGGNLQELLGAAGETPGADQNGGLPPAGAGAGGPPPEPPSAQERLQQAMPDIPPDALERYSPKLEEFEQQVGMTVMDPKQVEKFIKEMQKADKKIIDEAMKQYGEQNAQQMGVGSQAGWDDTAPKPNGGGGGMGGGAPPAPGGEPGALGGDPGAPGGDAAPAAPPMGGAPAPGGGMPPKPKKPPQGPGQQPAPASPDGIAKAAAAGAFLARARSRR